MTAKLVAVSGPLKDSLLALGDEEVSIGREESNRLCVADLSASRRHCVIKCEAGKFKIRDLDSRNGTFVNGLPVKERLLQHRDEIKVGNSLFLFLFFSEEVPEDETLVQLQNRMLVTRSTTQLRTDDSLYLQPEKLLETLPPGARIARNLNVLLQVSMSVQSVRSPQELARRVLELAFEAAPAERGAILLLGGSPDEFTSVLGRDRHSRGGQPVRVGRRIVDQVREDGVALLSNDISDGEDPPVTSLMAVPLMCFSRVRGMLYLDTSDPHVRFDEDMLQLLTAIGAIAAMAFENVRQMESLVEENRRLQAVLNIDHDMVGDSPRMRKIYQEIAKIASSDSTVLITGESGTGKELAARALHRNSPRAAKPFVPINCAALPENLLESELFGHEKGAFTGAIERKIGKLESANGGTVLLDEVGELALPLQAKLLRAIEEREFERVGSARPLQVDIRFIAATNKDLAEASRNGKFRPDLFFRLNVIPLNMPPLRERPEDIPLLANHFVSKFSRRVRRRLMGISDAALECLVRYSWPGNVRELANAIERAVVLGSAELILPEELPCAVFERESGNDGARTKYETSLREAKSQAILNAIRQSGGNITEAAKLLGLHPNHLHRLIRKLNLRDQL